MMQRSKPLILKVTSNYYTIKNEKKNEKEKLVLDIEYPYYGSDSFFL
jgi:hypothetical protein